MRNQHNIRNIDVSRAKRARRPAPAAPRRSAYDVQKDVQRPVSRGGGQGGASPQARRPKCAAAVRRAARYGLCEGQAAARPFPHAAGRAQAQEEKGKPWQKKLPLALCLCCASWQWGRPGSTGMWRILWPRAKAARLRRISPPRPSTAKTFTNILVLGIDYDDDPAEQALGVQRSKNGNTDMILYVQFNKKENTVHMLQIPRDTFVGLDLPTGGTGRINALYAHGADQENRVQNIAQVLYDQLQLPVDDYVVIDMQMLQGMMTALGDQFALQVYAARHHGI